MFIIFLYAQINGYDIIRHISSQESANKLLQTLSDLPEWEQLNDAMDDITVGDVYRAMYPNGFLHALNERILLRYGITTESLGKSLVLPEFSLHKIPIIPSTTTSEPKSSNNTETEQFDEHIYDDVNEERTNNLREQPLPDYAYDDQPIASREFVSTSAAREIRHVKGNRPKTVEKLPNERIEMGIYDWIQKFMSR